MPNPIHQQSTPRSPGYSMEHVGRLPTGDLDVGAGQAGDASNGALVTLHIRVARDSVCQARYKAFGCGWTIAAASAAAVWLQGQPVADIETALRPALLSELQPPPDKLHAIELAARATLAAVHDQLTKQVAASKETP